MVLMKYSSHCKAFPPYFQYTEQAVSKRSMKGSTIAMASPAGVPDSMFIRQANGRERTLKWMGHGEKKELTLKGSV